jgi:hypothetical protein
MGEMANLRRKTVLAAILPCTALSQGFGGFGPDRYSGLVEAGTDLRYEETVRLCADMVGQPSAMGHARRHGLDLLNLTWEDTARYKGSAVGPNISDMTIQVSLERRGRTEAHLMPVFRYPNFSDITGDIDPRSIGLLVGNHQGRPLKRVSLYDFLAEPARFMHDPRSWKGGPRPLVAERDSKVLVSAQACYLPVPRGTKATFNPVLFNYQSVPDDPAVLAILATREGTSMTVIDNQGQDNGWNWGQRLFFNNQGQRASLTGERLSEYEARGGDPDAGGVQVPQAQMNMVMLIQVPLKQRRQNWLAAAPAAGEGAFGGGADMAEAKRARNEAAVIGHGEDEGPFRELGGLAIERDPRFPVRVTVQFYRATETGQVSSEEVALIKKDIDLVYASASTVGSLVTGGRTGRVTEYDGVKVQPPGWWSDFWRRYESYSGVSRTEAQARLARLLGEDYAKAPVCELYLRDLLRP